MIKYFLFAIFLCTGPVFGGEEAPWKQITVNAGDLGDIVGAEMVTSKNFDRYYTFTGIPYADPLSYTGTKRFEPSSIWTGPLNTTGAPWYADKVGNLCPQRAILDLEPTNATQTQDLLTVFKGTAKSRREVRKRLQDARKSGNLAQEVSLGPHWGTEECLTLNINVPAETLETPGEKLPVVVYFHGGGADSVFGSVFMGLRLMERPVLLITLNYRLGILGAFNLGVDGAPGCGGAYDGLTALQWINTYITHFGGDPDRVTITGQSAGAMMVTHLMLSPLTKGKGYFNGVVGFSGSALSVWATAHEPSMPHHLKVAQLADCYDGTSEPVIDTIVQCMKSATLQTLVEALDIYEEDEMYNGRLGFDARVPSIQHNAQLMHPRFLPKDPLEVLVNGEQDDVNLMLGATKHDGSYPLDDIYVYYLEPNGLLEDENYMQNEMLPELLAMLGLEDPSRAMYHSFQRQYLGESAHSTDFDSKMPGLLDMSTIFGFKAGQYRFIEEHAKKNPKSYVYSFDYVGRWTLYEVLQGFNKKIPGGIAHTDEQMYLFYMGPMLNEDARVSERMLDYLVNFAYHGNPNGDVQASAEVWKRHDSMKHPYFEINKVDRSHVNARNSWINASLELFPENTENPATGGTETPETSTVPTGTVPTGTVPTGTSETPEGTTPSGASHMALNGVYSIMFITVFVLILQAD